MLTTTLLFLVFQISAFVLQSHQKCSTVAAPDHGDIRIYPNYLYHVVCDHGYIVHGKPVVGCKNNEWDSPPPTCIREQTCQKPLAPQNGIVTCDAEFLSVGKACYFYCNSGYELQGSKVRRCLRNGNWSGQISSCIVRSNIFCPYPPALEHGKIVGCSPFKFPKFSESCSFKCNEGYILKGPSSVFCTVTGRLKDDKGQENFPQCVARDDDAVIKKINPGKVVQGLCINHTCEQQCQIENGQPQCRCRKGYILNEEDQRTCKRSIRRQIYASNPCLLKNGGCEHFCSLTFQREVFCSCREGYTRSGWDLKNCTKDSAEPVSNATVNCSINNGGCDHICTPVGETVICSCHRGYKLHFDRKQCIDIDECLNEQTNNCQHNCHNIEGSYTCSCRAGYILIDGEKCEGCGINSYWSDELRECVKCPRNSHTVSEGKSSIVDCICNSGFIEIPLDGSVNCQDINECDVDNFGCSDICVNVPGSAHCTCPSGFMLDTDNKTCIDINECDTKNGGCEGVCHNLYGSFRCSCQEGFSLSNKNHFSCVDVDECLINNGGCEQKCINYHGGYHCACEKGYRLDRDLKYCTAAKCPSLPELPHSRMKCHKDEQRLLNMESYSVGTNCSYICDRGFKNTKEENNMECQDDGTWKGNLPTCKAQQCRPLSIPENGAVHPSSCSIHGSEVKQKCTFTCESGYKLIGDFVVTCKNNLTWSLKVPPVCQPEKIQPRIQCPKDITVMLLPGKNTYNITLPKPTTNMEIYEVYPKWISANLPVEFPAGITKVSFATISQVSNKTAKCITTVSVLDVEPPVFEYCPESINLVASGADGEIVLWEEPVVTDNVQVESIFSLSKPNTTFTVGTHIVEYIARDDAGNTASCSFDISITRVNCTDLINPIHGEANCVDWIFGKLCQPVCEVGFMRNPDDPEYYYCDDTGVWEPSDVIGDCLPECPSNTEWSEITKKCEEITK